MPSGTPGRICVQMSTVCIKHHWEMGFRPAGHFPVSGVTSGSICPSAPLVSDGALLLFGVSFRAFLLWRFGCVSKSFWLLQVYTGLLLFTFLFLLPLCFLFFRQKLIINAHANEEIDACDNEDPATGPVRVFVVSIYVIEPT